MNISSAIVLSRKKSTKFLGEVYSYQSNEEVIAEGVLDGSLSLSDYATGHTTEETITVNGQSFGTGVIKSVTVSAKNQTGVDKRVRVTFEVFKVGGSASLSAEYPAIAADDFKYIKSFSESSSCDISQEVQSYSHSVSVKLTKYDGTGIATAKAIASTFLNSNNLTSSGSIDSSSYDTPPGKTFFDETYDEVNSECNFSKKYEIATNADSNNNYILFRSNSLSYDSSGIATVTENAEYQDLTGNGAPTSQANTDMDGAYGRCTAILTALTGASPNIGEMTLIDMPLVKGMTIDRDTRKVTYRVNYTTNIKINEGDKVYHEYTNTKETTNAGVSYYLLEGNIVGMEEVDSAEDESTKYKNAKPVWLQVAGGTFPNGVVMTGRPHSFSTNHNQIKGTIGYNIKYSDCISIIDGAGTIRRKIHKVSTQPTPRSLAQTFRVINRDEILQLAQNGNKLPSNYIASSTINGDSTVQMGNLVGSVVNATPVGSNYGQSVSLSYNSASRQLSAAIHVIQIP
jgi:hypothetical protein